MKLKKLYNQKKGPMRLAIFMSGSGSNATKIIERYIAQREAGNVTFEPVLMFTDNKSSNAEKIGTEDFKDQGVVLPVVCNPLTSKRIDDRAKYDGVQVETLRKFGVGAIALAGYDWIVTPEICDYFLTTNVHPGDLRVRKENGKRRYIGLGWIPSAKAILRKEPKVYTSVHLVTPELDGGPLLAISAPQDVQEDALGLEKEVLLGEEKSLKAVKDFIRQHPEMSDEEIGERFPIYGFASDCQERLKVDGDWIEFPDVIVNISLGKYERDMDRNLYFDNKPIPNGVVRGAV